MAIKDMNDLKIDNKPKAVDKFIKSADMTKTRKSGIGRPKKKESEKANKQVFINLTEEQKNKLDNHANEMGISSSTIMKMLLKKEGII
jgi:transcriptional regulator with PAS, ATPase and Fis domain